MTIAGSRRANACKSICNKSETSKNASPGNRCRSAARFPSPFDGRQSYSESVTSSSSFRLPIKIKVTEAKTRIIFQATNVKIYEKYFRFSFAALALAARQRPASQRFNSDERSCSWKRKRKQKREEGRGDVSRSNNNDLIGISLVSLPFLWSFLNANADAPLFISDSNFVFSYERRKDERTRETNPTVQPRARPTCLTFSFDQLLFLFEIFMILSLGIRGSAPVSIAFADSDGWPHINSD